MFTGIIETVGVVHEIIAGQGNKTIWIQSDLSSGLHPDQSVSHDGVCLTIEQVNSGMHRITVIKETLLKSSLSEYHQGKLVNIERCVPVNGRFDGHIVQGHVDSVGTCIEKKVLPGSVEFRISVPERFGPNIVEKGSIALNGISLTLFNVKRDEFTVAVIPYTLEHTSIKNLKEGELVNLEFDIIGKYVQRIMQFNTSSTRSGIQ